MFTYGLLLLTALKLVVTLETNHTLTGVHIQIFDNIAEITRVVKPEQLPVQFSQLEWFDIRSDSIRFVGYCLTIRSQHIEYKQASLNGEKILVKRDLNNDTFTEAIMIDETRNLIQDLTDNTFYTVTSERIRYFSIPPIRVYSVNFTYDIETPDDPMYLRYLQDNIRWKVRYDLLFEGNDTHAVLQGYADIRNDGNSLLAIDSAELISGDLNIRNSMPPHGSGYGNLQGVSSLVEDAEEDSAPAGGISPGISSSEELQGLYIFKMNQSFTLSPRSNFILPMISPKACAERYALIEKFFSTFDSRGNAQRAYRVRVPDTYLPKGQVFVRESDRLAGETFWQDSASNQTNEFTLGQDPDLQYSEFIQLSSRRQTYEANGYRFVLSTYTITIRLFNNKPRTTKVEYRLKFSSQDSLTLKENTNNNALQLDGSNLVGIFYLEPNEEQQYRFVIETK